jgi:hypothetical protein
VPVAVRPDLAYEWSNYRLASQKINSYKGKSTAILDPFHIQPGWFVLNFTNLFIEPGSAPPPRAPITPGALVAGARPRCANAFEFAFVATLGALVALPKIMRRDIGSGKRDAEFPGCKYGAFEEAASLALETCNYFIADIFFCKVGTVLFCVLSNIF